MISIVMASYLGYYPSAAKNREQKIIRAIQSVKDQTFKDWELIIVGDSCQRTIDIVKPLLCDNIRAFNVKYKRSGLFQPFPRNTGIQQAKGEWIAYLDIDDIFGVNHLENISKGMIDTDWIWFDDMVWNGKVDNNVYNDANWNVQGRKLEWTLCGTSNVAHKNNKDIYWFGNGYRHDWDFIREKLIKPYPNVKYVKGSEYKICHIPARGGYDV